MNLMKGVVLPFSPNVEVHCCLFIPLVLRDLLMNMLVLPVPFLEFTLMYWIVTIKSILHSSCI